MIRLKAGPLNLIGLSSRNLELLRAGKPIRIDLAEFNLEGELIIVWGETELELARQLATPAEFIAAAERIQREGRGSFTIDNRKDKP